MATKFWKSGHRPDYLVIAAIFILVAFGFVMLASASSELGKKRFDDTYYYVKHQALYGLLPGILGFFLASKLYYRVYQKIAFLLLLASMIVLMLVFSPLGYRAGGAERWLNIGSLIFQPAEFLKITFIIYLAAWFGNPHTKRNSGFFEGFIPFLLICGLVLGTLIIQPATSVVVILLGAGLAIYFLSGGKVRFIAAVSLIALFVIGALIYYTPYRFDRIKTFLHIGGDTQSE
ncbi:MAG: FtsW/RodA/SpoVE family cell cycle protein, partial [Patescibacteria group bacterium]